MYLIYMYEEDLALNNLQWLVFHKTQTNQITHAHIFIFYLFIFLLYNVWKRMWYSVLISRQPGVITQFR